MHRPLAAHLLCFAVVLSTPLAALASPVTVPTGLAPGDHYRLAFVTRGTRTATSNAISDYNDFVTTEANSEPLLLSLATTWKAIATTDAVNARDNTDTYLLSPFSVPIYNLLGTRIADDNADLWDGFISAPIVADQQGSLQETLVYTGTEFDGVATFWPITATWFPTTVGYSNSTSMTWINTGDPPSTKPFGDPANPHPLPFYALSGVLTVPPVPLPSSFALGAFLAAVGLAVTSLRRHQQLDHRIRPD